MNVIEFSSVSKSFTHHNVLHNIDLKVKTGEFFGLIGVNGAGKTTLIKSLLDFGDIDSGHIQLFNLPHHLPQARSQLAFLPERFIPANYFTGNDFLSFYSLLHGTTIDSKRRATVCKALDFNPSVLPRLVKTYSKGMAQKLGLLACLLSEKPLLVMDEPMSGLDPKARAYCKRFLLSHKQQGTTLFFTTHLLADVEALCDRMAILHGGKLHFVGSPSMCCQQFDTSDLETAYLRCIGE